MKIMDVMCAPWAITPDMLREIRGIYETHLRGDKIDIAGVEASLGGPLQNEESGYDIIDGVAVVPIHGVIAKKMNLFSRISGGMSSELVERDIREAIDDPGVTSIVLDIDSPGGTVDGTQELADAVYSLRGEKPIIALANGLMASAAYYIGSAADSVFASSGQTIVGSIGVVGTHIDVSGAEEKAGRKTTEIYAGKYKRIDSSYKPLTKEGRDYLQDQVDYMYSVFVDDVAKFRGVSVNTVLEDMADGRLFIGQQAVDAGLVDGISTLGALIADLSDGRMPGISGAGAVAENDASEQFKILTNQSEADMPEDNENTFSQADIDAARVEGFETGKAEGLAAGATAECARAKAVFEQGKKLPGHSALVEAMIFDGKTTGPEPAVQILGAEQAKRGKVIHDIEDDAPDAVDQPSVDDDDGKPDLNSAATFAKALQENMDNGMSRGKAMKAAARDFPVARMAWINEQNKGSK